MVESTTAGELELNLENLDRKEFGKVRENSG